MPQHEEHPVSPEQLDRLVAIIMDSDDTQFEDDDDLVGEVVDDTSPTEASHAKLNIGSGISFVEPSNDTVPLAVRQEHWAQEFDGVLGKSADRWIAAIGHLRSLGNIPKD